MFICLNSTPFLILSCEAQAQWSLQGHQVHACDPLGRHRAVPQGQPKRNEPLSPECVLRGSQAGWWLAFHLRGDPEFGSARRSA